MVFVCEGKSHKKIPMRTRFRSDEHACGNPLLSLDKLTRVQDRIAKSWPGNLQIVLAKSRWIVRTKESARCQRKLQFLAGGNRSLPT